MLGLAPLALPLQVGVGRDGHPLLYGPPMVDMDDSFPLQQPLLKHLVPQSINMWMGCAPDGQCKAWWPPQSHQALSHPEATLYMCAPRLVITAGRFVC
jgi:hypothetical protein